MELFTSSTRIMKCGLGLLLSAVLILAASGASAGDLFFTTGGQPRFFIGQPTPGQIQRVKEDGTGQTVIIADTLAASGAASPHGITVNTIGGKIVGYIRVSQMA